MSLNEISLEQLEAEHGAAAVEGLLQRLLAREAKKSPHSPISRAVRAERTAASARARFDAVHQTSTTAPARAAAERFKAREVRQSDREEECRRLGRFVVLPERGGTFRVHDRLTGEAALYGATPGKLPVPLRGYATKAQASEQITLLVKRYEAQSKLFRLPYPYIEPEGPPAPTVLAEQILSEDLWAEAERLIPPASYSGGNRRTVPDRSALAALIYLLRHGHGRVPTDRLGCGEMLTRRRQREWAAVGCWPPLRRLLTRKLPDGGLLPWDRLDRNNVSDGARAMLLERLAPYQAEHGASASDIGLQALGHRGAIPRLRAAATMRTTTFDRLMSYLNRPYEPPPFCGDPGERLVSDAARDHLLSRVEAHLTRTKVGAYQFGVAVRNSPALVLQLRKGRALKRKTLDAVMAYLDNAEAR